MRIVKLDENSKKNVLENMLKRSPNNYGDFQDRPSDRLPDQKEAEPCCQAEAHGSADRIADILLRAFPDALGRHYIGADGDADENVDQKQDDIGRGTDRGKRFLAHEAADDDHVRRVEAELQDIGQHERHGKSQHPLPEAAFQHIDLTLAHVSPAPFACTDMIPTRDCSRNPGVMV